MLLGPIVHAQQTKVVAIAVRPLDPVEAKSVSYYRQIRPLLESRCAGCHSGKTAMAGLDTNSVAALLKGTRHGPSLIPGKPDASAVVQYIRGVKTPQMPQGAPPLSVDQLHLVRQWIAAGARDDTAEQKARAALSPAGTLAAEVPVEDESSLTLAEVRVRHIARLPAPPPVPRVKAPVFNAVDRFIAAKWEARKLSAPTLCDDSTFVRRVYLDLIGLIPTVEEARAFVADRSPDKRSRLIDQLLARDDEYAAHWIPFWEDALCSNGKHQGGTGTRPNLRPWLMENLRRNRPFDEMAAELIDPSYPSDTKARTKGYIRNADHVETTQSAANVAQVFLGTALKCASCHNHFQNPEWPQRKFLAFASYFAAKDLEVIRCEVREGEFVAPAFIFDQPAAGRAAPGDLAARLKQVSRLIVDPENPRFARSIVNRLWKRYFGLGLVEPADDFRADRAASHPELLTWLADDFMRHGYDLKHTIRLLLNSRTYQLRYDPKLADSFDVSRPELPRYYRSPTLRRLTCEQLLDSIAVALGSARARNYLDNNSTALTRALGKPAARNEVSTARPDDVAVVQALEFLNGQEFNSRVAAGKLGVELSQERDPARIIERAYWSVYSRPPTTAELQAGRQFLGGDQERAEGALQIDNSQLQIADLQSRPEPEAPSSEEIIWIEDETPAGATLQGAWEWVESPVHSGKKSLVLSAPDGAGQRHFAGATGRLQVLPGDTLFVHVYLDPAAKPRELMLQWNDGSWDHRAYWGENRIAFGTDQSASRLPMGPLPEAGRWVRLEVPADQVGLAGREINGWSFDLFGGRAFFDRAGVTRGTLPREELVDLLWALVVSPEFQYVR